MYKLYYSPASCSMAVHVALIETGAEFELARISIPAGDNKKPEFLKLNPRGQVPVLVEDGTTVIREGGAILSYLLDKHKNPLLPSSGPARAAALEALMWANASLHPAYGRAFWAGKAFSDPAVKAEVQKAACAGIQSYWDEAEERLAKSKYMAGATLTMGDILMTVIANWNQWIPHEIRLGLNVQRVIREVIARPSYQKALKTEQVEYKAAA